MSFVLNRIATTNNNNSGSDNLYQQTEMKQVEDTQTLSFRDGTEQWMARMKDTYDSSRDVTYHTDVPLSEFFARPVKIAEYQWGTADVSTFYQDFNPWQLYIINKRVANRMSNYKNFSGKLHVKFVINGNSFMYGRIMCEYFPLRSYDNVSDTSSGDNMLIQASQRLHIFLDPTQSQGGELELPFVWFTDKVDLCAGDYTGLGQMYLRGMGPLKHAMGAVSTVNISVFAWAEDVKLSIPTVQNISGLVAQAGTMDEYGKGPVSSMASAVAHLAGKLSKIPIIGRYARATQMMAGTMSSVASIFGFSRPAIIADYTDMRAAPLSRIANYNTSDNVAKLSLDVKQELSIDPAIVGISPTDELSISYISSRESYITSFQWPVVYNSGDFLFGARVGPLIEANVVTPVTYYLPAITYASIPFQYWRGTVRYRFQIVASGFHKGRLLLVWDPRAQVTAPETNVQYSKIVDLAEERDFTFEVGWGANTTFLNCPTINNARQFNSVTPYTTTDTTGSYNGVIGVYVLNELVVPNTAVDNDIRINVFISACDDYEVAVPTSAGSFISQLGPSLSLTPQSGTFEEVDTENKNAPQNTVAKETFALCLPTTSPADSVYFGESVVSMRQLIRRYSLWSSLAGTVNASRGQQVLRMPDFPGHRGYSAYGAVLYAGAGGAGHSNPSNTTLMHYLALAYMAYRGGVRHKVIIGQLGVTASGVAIVSRDSAIASYPNVYARQTSDVITNQWTFAENRVSGFLQDCHAGAHVVPIPLQTALEFDLPMYTTNRFLSPRNLGVRGVNAADNYSHTVTLEVGATTVVPSYDIYIAGAEDSTFIGFQGCPPLRYIALE